MKTRNENTSLRRAHASTGNIVIGISLLSKDNCLRLLQKWLTRSCDRMLFQNNFIKMLKNTNKVFPNFLLQNLHVDFCTWDVVGVAIKRSKDEKIEVIHIFIFRYKKEHYLKYVS